MPSSLQARMTRSAISPRLAIKTFLIMKSLEANERLSVFDRLPLFHQKIHDLAVFFGYHFLIQMHGPHDSDDFSGLHHVAKFEILFFGFGIEAAEKSDLPRAN